MRTILKYIANDNSEWDTPEKAETRDFLIERVNGIMAPLFVSDAVQRNLEANKGYWQHDLDAVYAAREGIMQICRERGYEGHYPCFKHHGREVHPLSVVGRILSETDEPLARAWNRFMRIDDQGREWQQCYLAYTATPTDAVCLNHLKL